MAADTTANNPELDALFRKYENAPDSYVFAPLADAFRKAGRLDEAVEICGNGTRKHPDYPSGHVVLGKCYFDLGRVDEAGDAFRRVLDLDANNLVALKYLGMIEAGHGELDKAKEHFRQILALDPENREIRSMLEDLHATDRQEPDRDGDAEDEQFEGETISLGDDNPELSDELATTTLADIYAAQGYTDKAAKIYTEVLRRQPDNEEIHNKLKELLGEDIVADDVRVDVEDIALEAHAAVEVAGEDDLSDDPPGPPTEVEEESADEPADEPQETPADTRKREKVPAPAGTPSRRIDDQRSYNQFKRWLKNMQ